MGIHTYKNNYLIRFFGTHLVDTTKYRKDSYSHFIIHIYFCELYYFDMNNFLKREIFTYQT